MSIFKCKMCGGIIEFEQGASVGVCDHCGTRQTLPRLDDDRRANLYDRANHFRRNNEFDKAMGIYEQILNEDTSDAEAYWSLVLCSYGIEYVEDPATRKRVPTVNRTQFTSIFDDDNYKSALRYADSYQRAIYEEEANVINEIQKGILAISQREEPFDIFICYKETDNNGRRTPDSVLANDMYHQLVQEGFKVFFARITLEDKLGTAYEPYIFAALNSAKVMVVLGTKPEHFNAVWVKNEWSRYLALVKRSNGRKVLIPAYRDMDPYDLPEEFSHLQAQDMSKLGFMQDLIRGIKKILKVDEPKAVIKEAAVIGSNINIAPLLRRAFMFLEDKEWAEADAYCERVLDQDPENAQAYIGKLMAELHVQRQEELADCDQPFDNSTNFRKAIRFGGEKIASMLNGYIIHINERNENKRLTGIYDNAVAAMNSAKTEAAFKEAAEIFKTIPGFKDSDALAGQCLEKAKSIVYDIAIANMNSANSVTSFKYAAEIFKTIPGFKDADALVTQCFDKAEIYRKDSIYGSAWWQMNNANTETKYKAAAELFKTISGFKDSDALVEQCLERAKACHAEVCHKDSIYASAKAKMTGNDKSNYESAIEIFNTILDWKDVSEQINICRNKIEEINVQEINNRLALERKHAVEQKRIAEEKAEKRKRTKSIFIKFIIVFTLLNMIFLPTIINIIKINALKGEKYSKAITLIDSGEYEAAYILLNGLNYKDSEGKLDSIKPQYQKILISKAQVGSYVYFGSYEQDNNTENGKEDIEWIVLAKDGNRILVISRYALFCQPYNISDSNVTWETCSLRKLLNDRFLRVAFKDEERKMINSVTVSKGKNPNHNTNAGNSTTDQVFLLSITEVNKYFGNDSARQCLGTTYCNVNSVSKTSDGICRWWLRSPGNSSRLAAAVDINGSIYSFGYYVNMFFAVRPALWIDIGN